MDIFRHPSIWMLKLKSNSIKHWGPGGEAEMRAANDEVQAMRSIFSVSFAISSSLNNTSNLCSLVFHSRCTFFLISTISPWVIFFIFLFHLLSLFRTEPVSFSFSLLICLLYKCSIPLSMNVPTSTQQFRPGTWASSVMLFSLSSIHLATQFTWF